MFERIFTVYDRVVLVINANASEYLQRQGSVVLGGEVSGGEREQVVDAHGEWRRARVPRAPDMARRRRSVRVARGLLTSHSQRAVQGREQTAAAATTR